MTRTGARMQGMSLMEILVAMAIGLIGIVVITQAYLVNENYKRSTSSAGGAQTNGALALFSIERDARMGGWGVSWSAPLGCGGVRWYYAPLNDYSTPLGGLPALTLAPVLITDGGAGPDTITVLYGTSTERVIPATLGKTMATSADAIEVDNPQGFSDSPGDLILLVQGTSCAMVQVTSMLPATGQLLHVASGTAPYNPPGGGALPLFSAGAQVFNLGRPVVNSYSIAGNRPVALLRRSKRCDTTARNDSANWTITCCCCSGGLESTSRSIAYADDRVCNDANTR